MADVRLAPLKYVEATMLTSEGRCRPVQRREVRGPYPWYPRALSWKSLREISG